MKPIFIILMQGRLGNLMFEYALLLSLRSRYPEYKGYLYRLPNSVGLTGYASDLQQIFGISASDFASDELLEYIKTLPFLSVRYIREQQFSCKQAIVLGDSLATICIGYWQTESYFEELRSEVRNSYHFNANLLNAKTRELAEKIHTQCTIGVHIRRGDYFTPENQLMYGGICTIDYYTKALNLIFDRVQKDCTIYLFSDDPEWVRSNTTFPDSVVVDWNYGADSWQDMYLMSLCHHNVIANSTFSWWGAWLNSHDNKIVVAPYRCFNTMFTPGIHPKEWLTVYPKGYKENRFISLLEKNEIMIDKKGLFYGEMGVVVFLFHYAAICKDDFYENIATNMLDGIFSQLNKETLVNYADGLVGIGTAVEYLSKNGFVGGDTNEILNDLDLLLDTIIYQPNQKRGLADGMLGQIRYFRFRMMGQCENMDCKRSRKNSTNLKYLIDLLLEEQESFFSYRDEVVSELYELSDLNLYAEQLGILFDVYLPASKDSYEAKQQQAAQINKKRIDKIHFGDTPGLMGMAGKELKILSPASTLHWTTLL